MAMLGPVKHDKGGPQSMSEFGTVIAFKGKLAQVEIPRSERCRGCHACTPLNGKDSMTLFAINDCGAHIGDQVEIQIRESGELSASLLLYGAPLAVFLLGILIFNYFFSETVALLLSLALIAVSYLIIHILSPRLNRDPYMPRAVRILPVIPANPKQ